MNRSSNRKGRKSANRVRKYSGGATHHMALTGTRHSLREVDAALIMINNMITNAERDSILKLSPLPSQLTEVETQLTEVKGRGQEWEEKEELARREKAAADEEARDYAENKFTMGVYAKTSDGRVGMIVRNSRNAKVEMTPDNGVSKFEWQVDQLTEASAIEKKKYDEDAEKAARNYAASWDRYHNTYPKGY